MRWLGPSIWAAARLPSSRFERLDGAGPADAGAFRWDIVLVTFERLLASAWLAQALMQWTAILVPHDSVLEQVSVGWGAATVFFAVVDPVAAVGLWLATQWGGVIWILAVASRIVAAVVVPGFFSPIRVAVDALLVGLYFLLTRLARRSRA